MRKKKLAARVCSAALAAAMVFGTAMTVSASEIPGDLGGGFVDGASNAENRDDKSYPTMEDNPNLPSVTQFVDLDWEYTPIDTVNADNTGKIVITGIEHDAEKNVIVEAYQFIRAKYEGENGMFSGWEDILEKGFFDTEKKSFNRSLLSRDMMATLVTDLNGETPVTLGWDETCNGYSAMVAPGSYVIVVRGAEAKTYGPMVVSLAYAQDDNHVITQLKGSNLGLVANMAYAKMQDEPTIEKEIHYLYSVEDLENKRTYDVTGKDGSDVGATALAGNGESIDFDIIVNSIPEYHGNYITFNVVDEMSKGLQLGYWFDSDDDGEDEWYGRADAFEFYVGFGEGLRLDPDDARLIPLTFEDGKEPTFSFDGDETTGTKITIDFKDVYKDVLQDYAGYHLFIRYGATIKATSDMYDYDAVDNVLNATNKATINFTHNSTIVGDDDSNSTDKRNVYVFKVGLKKVDSNGDTPLPGATFKLESAADPSGYDEDALLFKGAEVVSGADGMLVFDGLAPGVYHLTEVDAPANYALDKTVHTLEIRVGENDLNADQELVSVTYIFDGDESNGVNALATVHNIKNTKMTELPSTGGAGTALLLIIGIGGAILGFVVLAMTRKKDEDK